MDTVSEVARAIARFIGFFFALVVALTVSVVAYALIQGANSQVWTALETLLLIDAILLVLCVAAAVGAHYIVHGKLPTRPKAAAAELSSES